MIQPNPPNPCNPGRYQVEGYQALLADYCQTADQVASLTGALIQLWEAHNNLLTMLDMPRLPLPLAALRASAATTAAPSTPVNQATTSPATDTQCPYCRGCGLVDDGEGAAWSDWLALDPRREGFAVVCGIVKPITCPACSGTGALSLDR